MAKENVGRRKRPPKVSAAEVLLDLIKEEELPDYQYHLQMLVTAVQQDPTFEKDVDGLGPASLRLAFVVIDPRVRRTVTDFCFAAGVNRSTYYEAINNPRWVAFRNKLARTFTDDAYVDAVTALRQLIKLGDNKALRLFFELRGDLVQRIETKDITETPEERMKRLRAKEAAQGKSVTVPAAEPVEVKDDDDVPF